MEFNADPGIMEENGQIWFPCDYARIRWWATEGKCAIVRPGLPPSRSAELGFDRDVFWAYVGHLPKETCDRIFAEWVVGRPDLGIAVTASKLEVALNGYYELLGGTDLGAGSNLTDLMGQGEMRAAREQFSSRSPSFSILSTKERAPFVTGSPDGLSSIAETCENIGPMKKSIYYKG